MAKVNVEEKTERDKGGSAREGGGEKMGWMGGSVEGYSRTWNGIQERSNKRSGKEMGRDSEGKTADSWV